MYLIYIIMLSVNIKNDQQIFFIFTVGILFTNLHDTLLFKNFVDEFFLIPAIKMARDYKYQNIRILHFGNTRVSGGYSIDINSQLSHNLKDLVEFNSLENEKDLISENIFSESKSGPDISVEILNSLSTVNKNNHIIFDFSYQFELIVSNVNIQIVESKFMNLNLNKNDLHIILPTTGLFEKENEWYENIFLKNKNYPFFFGENMILHTFDDAVILLYQIIKNKEITITDEEIVHYKENNFHQIYLYVENKLSIYFCNNIYRVIMNNCEDPKYTTYKLSHLNLFIQDILNSFIEIIISNDKYLEFNRYVSNNYQVYFIIDFILSNKKQIWMNDITSYYLPQETQQVGRGINYKLQKYNYKLTKATDPIKRRLYLQKLQSYNNL